ncbi:hypothetical protein VN97_g1496 [Penicillium thymicola]|uniref:Uncharacterized protein n=1 Tax=Penicillium thymicola TaxID=293382 RepID=A0AAI9TQX3_PENTH|nr:hypothetical protein VN97_g1496 [Penicillium thymicola]
MIHTKTAVNETSTAWLYDKFLLFASSKQIRKCHTKEANPHRFLSPLPPFHSSQGFLKIHHASMDRIPN